MHHRYWLHPESSFVQRGPFALKISADGSSYFRLLGRTLQRTRPSDGVEVIATASSWVEWRTLAWEHFGLPLDDLTEQEQAAVWERASADHAKWQQQQQQQQQQQRKHKL
jgi:hypothetical protein